LILKNLI